MVLNSYFLQGSKSEQNLLQSLINEQIQMYGVEVYYIPRKYITTNSVIKEVIESTFDDAYPIEAYVDNYEGYGGQGTILSKFGIQEQDDLTLIISRDRYESYIAPLMKNTPKVELYERPKEGDIIYFPLGDRLFEIKYVEHEQPFYQLKKNYVYQLRCELFRYEDEVIDTGIEAIDDEIEQVGYIQTLSLIGAATQATASASYCASGGVNKIYMSNMGNGYTSQPVIGFSSAPSGGITAVGIASINQTFINCDGTQEGGKIQHIYITNSGCGYTVAPWITIGIGTQSGGGVGAAATAGISTGTVGVVTLTGQGSGYTTSPAVTFSAPPSGINSATGYAAINASGIVTAFYVTYGGIGYTGNPTVTIDAPGATGIGTGSYIYNEVVTGQTSGTTARVRKWNVVGSKLSIATVDGTFLRGEQVLGGESGAVYVIGSTNTYDTSRTNVEETLTTTPFADNANIETQGDSILDFTETNPFGMP